MLKKIIKNSEEKKCLNGGCTMFINRTKKELYIADYIKGLISKEYLENKIGRLDDHNGHTEEYFQKKFLITILKDQKETRLPRPLEVKELLRRENLLP